MFRAKEAFLSKNHTMVFLYTCRERKYLIANDMSTQLV